MFFLDSCIFRKKKKLEVWTSSLVLAKCFQSFWFPLNSKSVLDKAEMNVITGTPCQTRSLRFPITHLALPKGQSSGHTVCPGANCLRVKVTRHLSQVCPDTRNQWAAESPGCRRSCYQHSGGGGSPQGVRVSTLQSASLDRHPVCTGIWLWTLGPQLPHL